MIRRDDHDHWYLIPQIEHARLAAEVARHWGNDDTPPLPLAELLVQAVRHHDDGWHAWDYPQRSATPLAGKERIDSDTGWPRSFIEMRMADSTAIWTRGIAACLQGDYSHAEVFARLSHRDMTPGLAMVLDAVLSFRVPFDLLDVSEAIRRETGHDVPPAEVSTLLDQLRRDGVVRTVSESAIGSLFEVSVPAGGRTVLPAIWVSRHFCWLAEKAREHRHDDPAELAACERFLSEQQQLQQEWQADLAGSQSDEQLRVLMDAGFRFVQFFDRISLWLCTAERTQPTEMEIPYGGTPRLIPHSPNEFTLEPFPLNVNRLTLTAPAWRIPARSYADDADLQLELRESDPEPLPWVLFRE